MRLRTRNGAIVALIALIGTACGGPFLMFPGGKLSGEVVGEPVSDWSFVDTRFIEVETHPSDPYSVELNYIVRDGNLYIDPAEGRSWLDYIRENPNLRIRFSGRVYPVTAELIGKPGELEGFDPDRFIYQLKSRP
jgi:hypothetical protein